MNDKYAIEILPAEAWTLTFEYLEDLDDLFNVYGTCRLFKDLLSIKSTTWKFTKVFPSLFHYLPKQDILNARSTCTHWCWAVEKYLEEEQPALHKVGEKNLVNAEYDAVHRSLEVDIARNTVAVYSNSIPSPQAALKSFLKQFGQESEENIFPSRSVHLYANSHLDFPLILKIFRLHGHHIWRLNFRAWLLYHISPQEVADFLWTLLRFVPNLRKLQLFAMIDERILLGNKAEAKALYRFLEENPAPRLYNLNNATINVNIQQIKLKLLTAYAPRLTSYSELWEPGNQYYKTFGNLKKLTWTFSNSNENDLQTISNLSCAPITHLCVNLINLTSSGNKLRPCTITLFTSKLFSSIEFFGDTLKHLTIYWTNFNETFPISVYLPHLQEIRLEFDEGCPTKFSLTFLESLKSLRKAMLIFPKSFYCQIIDVKQHDKQMVQQCTWHEQRCRYRADCMWEEIQGEVLRKEQVDLQYYLDDMYEDCIGAKDGLPRPYESSIWRLIPSLKNIVVKVYWHQGANKSMSSKLYSRREYNNAQVLTAKSASEGVIVVGKQIQKAN